MTESSQGGQGARGEPREPFVSQGDRPEVRLDPDTPLSELRLRDLTHILGGSIVGKLARAEWGIKIIVDNKYLKFEKNEKIEIDYVVITDPFHGPGPDPRLDQVIQAVTGLTTQVQQLSNQVEEIRRKTRG